MNTFDLVRSFPKSQIILIIILLSHTESPPNIFVQGWVILFFDTLKCKQTENFMGLTVIFHRHDEFQSGNSRYFYTFEKHNEKYLQKPFKLIFEFHTSKREKNATKIKSFLLWL